MKTIIKISVKEMPSVEVKETVQEVYKRLIEKGSFLLLTKVGRITKESQVIIKKSIIKLVIQQK